MDTEDIQKIAEKFDHLSLLVKDNDDIRAAYWAGHADGRAKEAEVVWVRYNDFRDRIDAAVKKVPARLGELRGMKLTPKSRTSIHAQMRQWYVDGFLTALKMARRLTNPKTIIKPYEK